MLTNVGITYTSSEGNEIFDKVTHTERRFVVMLGSHSRFGFFTKPNSSSPTARQ